MRQIFEGYYPLTKAEEDDLWHRSIIVPDVNVLFHLFRVSRGLSDRILEALRSAGDRLWMPHQVGLEFQRGWRRADQKNRETLPELKGQLGQFKGPIKKTLSQTGALDESATNARVDAFFADLYRQIDEAGKALRVASDIHDLVSNLFIGRVGAAPSVELLGMRNKEADRRRSLAIPPCVVKGENSGDFLIWDELKVQAKAKQRPVLFVTDDTKEDWWGMVDKVPFGPHPELRREFKQDTGQTFYAYLPTEFVEIQAKRSGTTVPRDEIRELQRAQDAMIRGGRPV